MLRLRSEFVAFAFATYILPPILVFAGVIPFQFMFLLLALITTMAAGFALVRRHRLASLGFRIDTLRNSMHYNLWVTVASLLIIAALFFSGVLPLAPPPRWHWFFVFYVLASCPAQEFLFRSVLFAEMDRARIAHREWQVMIAAVLYSFPHLAYHSLITLAVAFAIGVAWSYGYSRYRNFWGVTVSHCILGTIAILVGLV